jgi:formylmethanofuran dehydrogenase subunit B
MNPPLTVIRDCTCLACGCLCDDIDVCVNTGRIIAAERACAIGQRWFQTDHTRRNRPIATIDGAECRFDQAVAKAAALLAISQSPLIIGLTQTTIEAQREALALADRLGATIDPGRSPGSLPRWHAVQRVGMVSATLGEVRDRADVVVFWNVDPVTNQPRHLERYSGDPIGRFVPAGRSGRKIVVVGAEQNATAEVADLFVSIDANRQAAALSALRILVHGKEPADEFSHLQPLADILTSAHYGAFFFDAALAQSPGASANVEEALKLVRDLNRFTRFVALTMGEKGNAAGAEAVLSWQAGSPRAIDFAAGYPQFLPDEATAEARLANADAVLVVANDPSEFLSESAIRLLEQLPVISIGPRASDQPHTVTMNAATTGIHAGGTVMRCDGATLPLRPTLVTDLPTDRDWIKAIAAALEASS